MLAQNALWPRLSADDLCIDLLIYLLTNLLFIDHGKGVVLLLAQHPRRSSILGVSSSKCSCFIILFLISPGGSPRGERARGGRCYPGRADYRKGVALCLHNARKGRFA